MVSSPVTSTKRKLFIICMRIDHFIEYSTATYPSTNPTIAANIPCNILAWNHPNKIEEIIIANDLPYASNDRRIAPRKTISSVIGPIKDAYRTIETVLLISVAASIFPNIV